MLHSLFISGNCSTCFGWYFYPSSEAHTTVSTASAICHTVTAICRYRGRVGTGLSVLWVAYATAVMVWQLSYAVDTVVCAPDDGWKYHPKHVEQFSDINKLCNVASCWIFIGILLGAHYILHINRIRVNNQNNKHYKLEKNSINYLNILLDRCGRGWSTNAPAFC